MPVTRIRGRKLQLIRERHFRLHPLCVHCAAKTPPLVRAATELDHITPLFKGGTDTPANRQGLCSPCHAIKTASDLGHAVHGCDENGLPSNNLHHWNR